MHGTLHASHGIAIYITAWVGEKNQKKEKKRKEVGKRLEKSIDRSNGEKGKSMTNDCDLPYVRWEDFQGSDIYLLVELGDSVLRRYVESLEHAKFA